MLGGTGGIKEHIKDRVRAMRSFVLLAPALLLDRPVRPRNLYQRLAAFPSRDLPVDEAVIIRWNDHQVPWIEAKTDRDCAIVLGVVHAHLRLAQMEVLRRVALGRTAEMLGPVAIDVDRLLRTLGLSQAVPGILAMLPETTRHWLDGFVDGLNHAVAGMNELPAEFDLLALKPTPWTASDVIAAGRAVSADVNWLVWLRLWHLRQHPEWTRLWEEALMHASGPAGEFVGEASQNLLQTLLGAARGGSNAWAVAAKASATGGSLLACDPHLPITLPNLWLLAGYRCPSFHVTGLMLPGLPFVAIGRNPWLAWGGTATHAASSDLFDLSALAYEPLETRTDIIQVRGGKSVATEIRTSRYGPVISDAVDMGGSYALRWIGHAPSDEMSAMLAMNRARSFDEFRSAAEGFAVPGQNFIVAEASGRIAKQIAVRLPRRARAAPSYPIAQPADIASWQHLATACDFPPERDPPCGFVVSANDRPIETPVPLGFLFSSADRCERIRDVLSMSQPVSLRSICELQRDVALPSARQLRDQLVVLIEASPESEQPEPSWSGVLAQLRGWDGVYSRDSRGALVFELLLAHLCLRYYNDAERAFQGIVWTGRALAGAGLMTPSAGLFAALNDAVARTGKDLVHYATWGDLHRLVLAHPLSSLPLVGRRLVFADLPASGGSDTVMRTAGPSVPQRHSAVYGSVARFVADLAGMNDNYAVLLGGQDGWLGSDTMLDQLGLWCKGSAIRLPLESETIAREFPHVILLQPGEPHD
jgi:penicillin amidase